jgi:hypothetical protein
MRVLVIVALIAGLAHADDGDRKSAERAFRAGEKAYKAQNFAAAAANFEEAYKALPLPEIAFSAAQAYRRQYRVEPKLEHARRAVELYRLYLDKVKTGGRVGVAADSIGEMQREVDKLTLAGAKAAREANVERTRLGVSPVLNNEKTGVHEIADLPDDSDAKVTTKIDGKVVPPFQMVDVDPGSHQVHVEAEGYLPYDATERVVKGASTVAEVVLKPRPATVKVKTEAGARVKVDGRPAQLDANKALELPAGKHIITIARAGRVAVARDVDVARGQQLAIDAPLDKTARRRAVPFVATGAALLGGVALGGAVFAIVENSRASSELSKIQKGDQTPATADHYDQLIRRRDQVTTGSIIVGAAALGVAGIAGALYWLDGPSEENVRLAPAVSGSTAGIAVVGRF